jgi:hypothetical protein
MTAEQEQAVRDKVKLARAALNQVEVEWNNRYLVHAALFMAKETLEEAYQIVEKDL